MAIPRNLANLAPTLSTTGGSFSTTIGVGAATPSASGAGITFPATQSGSTDANTLDDYEEGTFTPTLKFDGNATGMTFDVTPTGTYVKVGKMVFCQCRMVLTAKGSSTGAATITGLPFTSQSVNSFVSGGECAGWNDVSYTGVIFINCGDNVTELNLFNMTEAGSRTSLTNSNFTNSSRFSWSLVYLVA